MLKINALHKTITNGDMVQPILTGVDLAVAQGESLAITGDSGSGKSTLLNILARFDVPDSGAIYFNQQDILSFYESQADNFRKSQIGFVFQQFNLIDCFSVYDNVAFPAKLNDCYQHHKVMDLLQKLGIEKHQAKLPNQLSGGEQQRVAIARALVHQPQLILADEPTGNLDQANSDKISDLLFSLCDDSNTSLLMVTHSLNLAKKAAKHLHLQNGQLSPP